MSKYALIKDGIVENIVEWDGAGDLFPAFLTEEITDIPCGIGWQYKDGIFNNPNETPEPSNATLYDSELNDINQAYDVEKKKLATAFVNVLLFNGEDEDKNKKAIQANFVELNSKYYNDISLLDEKYGDLDA